MTRRTGISTAPTARGGATSLLTVESLCKRFGGLQALDHLSFAVSTGEVLGIIGPNGAGKTALINCITGLYQADSGAIGLDGTDLSNRAPHQISRLGIARTFQNIRLFRRMSVLENVAVVLKQWSQRPLRSLLLRSDGPIRKSALQLLDRLRLADKADLLAGNLAYGEARRLEIARALATGPRLLFLDEPAAGMNEEETATLAHDIRGLLDQVHGVVVIEHDIGFIRSLSDRLIAMDYGRKIAEGLPQEVFANAQVVDAYLGRDDD